MAEEHEHILLGPRVGSALGMGAFFGPGLALMLAFPHFTNLLFWLGIIISLVGGAGAWWTGHDEIIRHTKVGILILGIVLIDVAAPIGVLIYVLYDSNELTVSLIVPDKTQVRTDTFDFKYVFHNQKDSAVLIDSLSMYRIWVPTPILPHVDLTKACREFGLYMIMGRQTFIGLPPQQRYSPMQFGEVMAEIADLTGMDVEGVRSEGRDLEVPAHGEIAAIGHFSYPWRWRDWSGYKVVVICPAMKIWISPKQTEDIICYGGHALLLEIPPWAKPTPYYEMYMTSAQLLPKADGVCSSPFAAPAMLLFEEEIYRQWLGPY